MLAWVDVETTGLDPDKDALLEVALVITDNALNEVCAEQYVLPFDLEAEQAAGRVVRDVVLKMHEKNGLWVDCRSVNELRRPLVEVEVALLATMRQFVEAKSTPICGSTVAFDRAFLRRHMPRFEEYFSHRNLDVSVLAEIARRWNPDAWDARPYGAAHRALDDIRVSIASMRHWLEQLIHKS